MKKIISVFLAIVMVFSIGAIAVSAEETTYEITFAEFPYDYSSFRDDYIGQYMGYEYGTDYWFTITNKDGTTTDIKGYPPSVTVEAGDSLEFTVTLSGNIELSSVRMLAFPTDLPISSLYNPNSGEPFGQYQIERTVANTYGIRPDKDMTICLSEYHLYNDCYLFDFPSSEYYTANRLLLTNPNADAVKDRFSRVEWGNTKVIYVDETLFFEVRMPMDNSKYDYHYDTYHVYYTIGDELGAEKFYLKKPGSEKEGTPEIDSRYDHYIDEETEEWVDVYEIPNVQSQTQIKVANTVTYTIAMLAQFVKDFGLENLDSIDLSTVDLGPMVELLLRIVNLIVKLLNSFGLNITLPDLFA